MPMQSALDWDMVDFRAFRVDSLPSGSTGFGKQTRVSYGGQPTAIGSHYVSASIRSAVVVDGNSKVIR
jgi:hypothetical protein